MPPQPLIPSSFLPHLPRSQNAFDPLSTTDLVAHIGILRELYIPPVHGGFEVSDCLLEDEDDVAGSSGPTGALRSEKREGEGSDGISERMDGLGLDVGSTARDIPSSSSSSSMSGYDRQHGHDTRGEEEEGDEDQESREHLDPFERDWSEKWLNGVVRRAQGWLEEHDSEDHEEVHAEWKAMEGILRDASAALAMMAGTSGMSPPLTSAIPGFEQES